MTERAGLSSLAHEIRRGPEAGPEAGPVVDHVVLSYEARLLRRRRLETLGGLAVLVDLPEAVSLDEGDALVLEDGRRIGIRAAEEPLIEVRGDLPRLAWHIGNRHTPCEMAGDCLIIRQDHVLAAMLEGLGAALREVVAPFRPEGGAYGHGRTMGHSHSHAHSHSHGPAETGPMPHEGAAPHGHHDHDHHHHHPHHDHPAEAASPGRAADAGH